MIEVDIDKIKSIINNYENIIKKIEQNNTDIIRNFDLLTRTWKDTRINNMTTSFNLEKQRIIRLENNIKDELSIYKLIEIGYEKLGTKIKCNLDSKDLINNKLDNIISTLSDIIYAFNNLGDISFYPRANLIYSSRNEIENILELFKAIKENINDKFTTIIEIEKNISEKLNSIRIEKFILNNYESEI